MSLVMYRRAFQAPNGVILKTARLEVSVAANPAFSGAPASLFSDDAGLVPLTQPVAPDSTGLFEFYIAPGTYDLRLTGVNIVTRVFADEPVESGASGLQDGDYGDVTVSGGGATLSIDANAVTTAKIANGAVTAEKLVDMTAGTIKGRAVGAGTGDPQDLSAAQATDILNVFAQDTKGLVPGPSAAEVAAGEFLRADGTWATPEAVEDLIEGLVYNHRRSPLAFSVSDLSGTSLTPTLATQVVCIVNGRIVTKAIGTALTFDANESGGIALDVQQDGTLVYYNASDYGGIVPEVADDECRICTVFTDGSAITSVLDSGMTEPKLQENARRVFNPIRILDSLLIGAAGTGTNLTAGGLRQAAAGKVDWYFISQGLRFFVKERPWMLRRYLDLYLSLSNPASHAFPFRIANYVEDAAGSGNWYKQGRTAGFVGAAVPGSWNGAGTVFTRSDGGSWGVNELVGQDVVSYLNASPPSVYGAGTWKPVTANTSTTLTVGTGFTNTFDRVRLQGNDSDSDDSYAASLVTLVRAWYDADPQACTTWLNTTNATHSIKNWDVLTKVCYYNLTTRMYSSGGFSGLVKTFQDDYNPTAYGTVAQCMDNCESARGLADLAYLLRRIGEPGEAAYYDAFANLNGNGIGLFFVTSDGQNATPPNAVGETTYNAFATRTYRTGTAQAGASSSITLDASASAVTDEYKGLIVKVVGGTGAGQHRRITAYNGTTKVATVGLAWATNPDNTSMFAIVGGTRKLGTDTYPAVDPGLYPGMTASIWPTLFDPPNLDRAYRDLGYTYAQYTAGPGAEERRLDFSPWLNLAYACIVKGEFEKAERWMLQAQRYNDPDNAGRYTVQDLGYWKACQDHFGWAEQNDSRVLDQRARFDGSVKGPWSAILKPSTRIVSPRKRVVEQYFGPLAAGITTGISAASTTRILAATALTASAQDVRTFAAQPDAPRVCRIVASGAGAGTCGNNAYTGANAAYVTIGGYCFGVWQVETIMLNGTTAVNGKLPFDEIVFVRLPAQTAANQLVSVGCGDVFGLDCPPESASDLVEFSRKASAATAYTIEALPGTTDLGGAETYLTAAIVGSATSLSVADGSVFPAVGSHAARIFVDVYDSQLNQWERMIVVGISGNTLTVVRDLMGEGGKVFQAFSRVRLHRGHTFTTTITANDRLKMAYRTRREL